MPCEIGQNIHKLRKKNKELLDLLESNSALLENKIKMLRHATRSPKKSDDLKNVPSSPLKRRYESSGVASSSDSRVKTGPAVSRCKRDSSPSNNENLTEKILRCDPKKASAKRIKNTGTSEIKKPLGRQAKGRSKVEDKNALKLNAINNICYCSKVHQHCKTETLKPKQNEGKCTKMRTEQGKNTHYLKEPFDIQKSDSKVKFLNDETEVPDVCLKCVDEARRLLNYSPESLFLRRMKERLQKSVNHPLSKDNVKINQICTCDNNKSSSCDSENDHTSSPKADDCDCGAVNENQIGNENDIQDQHCNFHLARGDFGNKKHCCCVNKQSNYKDAEFQTSKHLIDSSTQAGHHHHSVKKKIHKTHIQKCLKVEGSKSHKNIPKKLTSDQRISSDIRHEKCLCKKQVGGLCCCEVLISADGRHDHDDARFSAPLKSSVSAPAVSSLKPRKPSDTKQGSSEAGETEPEPLKLPISKNIQTTGYDIIAALAENDHRKYAADPCTYQLEELSNFRQKHWFDCHSHPHGTTSNEFYPGSKEDQNKISSFDDDLMQPTLDPCLRAYRLNQRLFPEAVKESHSAGCCISQQGKCISHRLLPTQRRLITLPSIPHQYGKEASATMKIPPGIETFPHSNILICDPTRMASVPNKSRSAVESPRRLRRPVPSNSLALRFQKGVA
ncbi:hypothetical protein R5R35_005952 [Gryllus longicercus]|uniref:Uncharacterized protein n=1 Tax=Gryllus longicercus TaxID=2509291 RepID=A0AAN9V6A8_9ORTH